MRSCRPNRKISSQQVGRRHNPGHSGTGFLHGRSRCQGRLRLSERTETPEKLDCIEQDQGEGSRRNEPCLGASESLGGLVLQDELLAFGNNST